MPSLTARQATVGKALLRKYRKTQIPADLAGAIFGGAA
jgi:hypothetical protein